jgi:hypothetical protein
MTNWPAVKELILFVLAIYAAGLSTFNLFQAVRRNRRTVLIAAGTKLPVINGEVGAAWANIEVTNVGQRPVTIKVIAFELEGGARLFKMRQGLQPLGLEDTELPITLADGQTARLHHAYVDIGQALMSHGQTLYNCKLTPICEDTAGGVHRGTPWIVDPKQLVRT